MKWENVYIFISSTFNDMHAERDYLVKYVFPELAEWCEARKLRLRDIDLRWGVTSADAEAHNTVKVCLENIDACRPFFLCFLGQRRGWRPDMTGGKEVSRETLEEYPELYRCKGRSVTEIEIEHALLAPMLRIIEEEKREQRRSEHALFFFREDNFTHRLTPEQRKVYTNAAEGERERDEDVKLQLLKESVRMSGKTVTHYAGEWDLAMQTPELLTEPDGEEKAKGRLTAFHVGDRELKQIIITQLEAEILKQFPGRETIPPPYTPQEADREQQSLFVDVNMEGYIPQKAIERELDNYINDSGNDIFLLLARAGLGKTMLLANYVRRLERDGHTVYARFCGVSDLSSEPYNLWKSLFDEAGIACPPTLNDLRQRMPELLEELSRKGKPIILIDAINQLPTGLEMLSWFPRKLPDGMKLILSVKDDGESAAVIQSCKGDPDRRIGELSPFEDKKGLIAEHLKKHLKALDDKHVDAICEAPASGNPLFMKILLSELRVFGAFKQLETAIKRYGEEPPEAFQAVLQRLETDVAFDVIDPRKSVPYLFGLLSHARKGLSEEELMYCFGAAFPHNESDRIRGTIRFYIRQMRPFMARREGRTDFLYESFMVAARERYKSGADGYHQALSACFLNFCDPGKDGLFETSSPRALLEYAYHLSRYDIQEAERLYCTIPYLHARCGMCPIGELLAEYNMFTQPATGQYCTIITRHAQTLSQYGNALFSILYYAAFDHAKRQIDNLLSTGRWNRPWICTDLLHREEDTRRQNEGALSLRKLAENTLSDTVAIQTAKNRNLAFYSERNGRIRSVDTTTLITHETIIRTQPMRPVNITASDDGTWLAVGYDDGTVEVIRLLFNENDIPCLSEPVKRLSYFLPMYDNGVFGFDDHFFWYQKDEATLVKTDLSGEKADLEIHPPYQGELSAILFRRKGVVFSVRQAEGTALISLPTDSPEVLATRYFDYTDIAAYVPLNDDRIALSLNDNRLLVLDGHLEEQAGITLDAPVVAAVALDAQLFLIYRDFHKGQAVLWDLPTGTVSPVSLDLRMTFIGQLSVKRNRDGSLFLITDEVMYTFVLSDEKAASQQSKIIAVDYRTGGTGGEMDARELVIVKEEEGYFTISHNGRATTLPKPFNAAWRKVLFAGNDVYAFDFGEGYAVSLDDRTVTPVQLKSNLNIACAGKDRYVYFYDAARHLRCLQHDAAIDLSAEHFTTASLHALDPYILLTGSTDNIKSEIRNETGYDSAPFLLLIYEMATDGRLHLIGERRFLKSQGHILSMAKREGDKLLYIVFYTPNTGKTDQPLVVGYGTAGDFLNRKEKEKALHCHKNEFSLACVNRSLLVCSNGIIVMYDGDSLEYQAAVAADEPFRFVRQIKGFPTAILAVCGKNDITRITNHQLNNK
ncbi:MAG: DUF4062 domain-containing protein [Tannerellaceae bacterium]|jgi:hypothetical protein|nr:DUF4062 domain-containing protein [Tannerellaceae bacterium]